MHFAARLGLEQFTDHLLHLAGSRAALHLVNAHGELAIDVAKAAAMDNLVNILSEYVFKLYCILGIRELSTTMDEEGVKMLRSWLKKIVALAQRFREFWLPSPKYVKYFWGLSIGRSCYNIKMHI